MISEQFKNYFFPGKTYALYEFNVELNIIMKNQLHHFFPVFNFIKTILSLSNK